MDLQPHSLISHYLFLYNTLKGSSLKDIAVISTVPLITSTSSSIGVFVCSVASSPYTVCSDPGTVWTYSTVTTGIVVLCSSFLSGLSSGYQEHLWKIYKHSYDYSHYYSYNNSYYCLYYSYYCSHYYSYYYHWYYHYYY